MELPRAESSRRHTRRCRCLLASRLTSAHHGIVGRAWAALPGGGHQCGQRQPGRRLECALVIDEADASAAMTKFYDSMGSGTQRSVFKFFGVADNRVGRCGLPPIQLRLLVVVMEEEE